MKPRKPKMINVPGYKGPDRRRGERRGGGNERVRPGYHEAQIPQEEGFTYIVGKDKRSGKDQRKKP